MCFEMQTLFGDLSQDWFDLRILVICCIYCHLFMYMSQVVNKD